MKMRRKSTVIRSSRKSIDPYSSLASLPDDEANEYFCSGEISTTHCDTDVEIVPRTFDERIVPHKKRHCVGTSDTDRGGSVEPLLNLDACIVCEVADERVSHCSGVDCLLSFHGECLYTDLGGSREDLANPYCPYCWLKFLALKSKTLREKTVVAEKSVFKYLDKEMNTRDEDRTLSGGEIGNQELQGEKDDCSSKEEEVQVEKDFDISRGENMPLIVETEERVATENFQDAEDDKNEETAKDQTRVSTGAGKKRGVSPFFSMQESFSGKEHNQVKQNEKRRRIELNTIDSETSSKGSSNERNGEDVTVQVTLSAPVTSPSGIMKNQHATTRVVPKLKTVRLFLFLHSLEHQEFISTLNLEGCLMDCRDISFFQNDQRRRLLWTCEEEEMLKVGVEKFAAEAKKNMPWRKILEMGEKVFHETRTPADLKDKWRHMVGARLGPKPNKTAH